MKRTGYLLLLLIAVFLYSCKKERYKGFSEDESGTYYQLLYMGEGDTLSENSPYVKARVQVLDFSGNAIYDNFSDDNKEMLYLTKDNFPSFFSIAHKLIEGDSLSLIFPAKSFRLKNITAFLSDTTTMLKTNIKIYSVLNKEEYIDETTKDQQYLQWLQERKMSEQSDLENYMASSGLTEKNVVDGVIIKVETEGKGERVEKGKVVAVHYVASYLNGEVFDDTRKNNKPLEFRYGDPDQVLRGFEIGISRMREGSAAKFVIPSALAFGEKGSSSGIVPPYSPIVYEINVIDVK